MNTAEMDKMLARGISWGGLGMYLLMRTYEPNALFTLDMLVCQSPNSREEIQEILDELLNAGYVFRTDEQIEGMATFAINRDQMPESTS